MDMLRMPRTPIEVKSMLVRFPPAPWHVALWYACNAVLHGAFRERSRATASKYLAAHKLRASRDVATRHEVGYFTRTSRRVCA